MPELPETETIARDLDAAIRGVEIIGATVHRADVLRDVESDAVHASVAGRTLVRVWRRAKLIVLDLSARNSANPDRDARHIVVQPRFTGSLLIDDGTLAAELRDYLTVSFTLGDARALHYRDVRRLGTLAIMSAPRFAEYVGALGREPLDAALTIAEFSALVRASRRVIKVLLMDQKRLAGVGNIYANEALWLAGIDPSRMAASLTTEEIDALLRELRDVLVRSIDARGTSFRDYRDARGERGTFVEQLAVYGRGGAPCLRCGRRLIDTHAVDGRTTVFCANCQR